MASALTLATTHGLLSAILGGSGVAPGSVVRVSLLARSDLRAAARGG